MIGAAALTPPIGKTATLICDTRIQQDCDHGVPGNLKSTWLDWQQHFSRKGTTQQTNQRGIVKHNRTHFQNTLFTCVAGLDS